MTCPHGMPSPASCLTCMEDGGVTPPRVWRRTGDPFTARYDGECITCGHRITAGVDRVQRWDLGDERTAYTHVGCGGPLL